MKILIGSLSHFFGNPHPAVHGKPYGVLVMELGLATCKASPLPTVLTLWPLPLTLYDTSLLSNCTIIKKLNFL